MLQMGTVLDLIGCCQCYLARTCSESTGLELPLRARLTAGDIRLAGPMSLSPTRRGSGSLHVRRDCRTSLEVHRLLRSHDLDQPMPDAREHPTERHGGRLGGAAEVDEARGHVMPPSLRSVARSERFEPLPRGTRLLDGTINTPIKSIIKSTLPVRFFAYLLYFSASAQAKSNRVRIASATAALLILTPKG